MKYLIVLLLFFLLGSPAFAASGLTGTYFNGISFNTPVFSRVDSSINFDYDYGSPDPRIPVDNFSVRWTGYITPQFTEIYTFTAFSDDGVRLWINNQKVIDEWYVHPELDFTGKIGLLAGRAYPITVEYYEGPGDGVIKLSWSSPSQPKQIVPSTRLSTVDTSSVAPTALPTAVPTAIPTVRPSATLAPSSTPAPLPTNTPVAPTTVNLCGSKIEGDFDCNGTLQLADYAFLRNASNRNSLTTEIQNKFLLWKAAFIRLMR